MENDTTKATIVEKECRFVLHVPANRDHGDLHMVKEVVHLSDGTSYPNIAWVKNYMRSFFITTPSERTYKQKKENESLDRLMKYRCTQSEMKDKIADVLGIRDPRAHLKILGNSPYLYGTEIPSESIIKKSYQERNKKIITPYTVAALDIETDMIHGTEEPIIITVVMKNEILIVMTQDYVNGITQHERKFREACVKYMSEFVKLSDYTIEYIEALEVVDMIRKTFAWIHQRKPDFLAIWNMDFDIPKIIDALEKRNINPADILCDPSIPKIARVCRYKQGQIKRRKANGKEVSIDVADRWHTLYLTASFYVIDAMCVYRLLRLSNPKQSSYSLDSILDLELGIRKLKFKEADAYHKARWHIFMQTNYKIEYMVYAVFDSLSMILLDNKIQDLQSKMSGYAGMTAFHRCNSKPKLTGDLLHFYYLQNGYVINSVGESTPESVAAVAEEDEEIDEDPVVLGTRDWIMTLPAHLVVPGLRLIAESDMLFTKLRAMVYDSDCVSAYPRATSILNVSKTTTKREIIAIANVEEPVFRLQNINLFSGYVNALEYGEKMFNLPSLLDLADSFDPPGEVYEHGI